MNPDVVIDFWKQPEEMRRKGDRFRVAVLRLVEDLDLHPGFFPLRRFMKTRAFMVCPPLPLKVPRKGVASR